MNAFRNKVALDYNPSIATVLQLVRLLQAEFESAFLSSEAGQVDKKARLAALQQGQDPIGPKGPTQKASSPPPPPEGVAKAMDAGGEIKGKGKGKESVSLRGFLQDLRSHSAAHTRTHTFLRARALSQALVLEPNKVRLLCFRRRSSGRETLLTARAKHSKIGLQLLNT